jgi:hypothetical protein
MAVFFVSHHVMPCGTSGLCQQKVSHQVLPLNPLDENCSSFIIREKKLIKQYISNVEIIGMTTLNLKPSPNKPMFLTTYPVLSLCYKLQKIDY